MPDDELERLLGAAFDARARSNFPDDRMPPPMRLPDHLSPRKHAHRSAPGRRARWLAPLAAAAAVLVTVAIVLGLTSGSDGSNRQNALGPSAGSSTTAQPSTRTSAATSSSTSASATASSRAPATGKPVKIVSSVIGDGSRIGVGLPISILLSRQIKDARELVKATRVTVNGKAVHGAWYFQRKYQDPGHPVEADYRMQNYWPGHSQIHFALPVKGISAGTGLVFANDLTLDFETGPANIATVDNATHRMTVVSDGKTWGSFPVSLGDPRTPTKRGIKVIMEKGRSICMSGPGYHECGVKDTQRLTYDGEYLHAAPWNCTGSPGCTGPQSNIGRGNSSNGCTNLTPTDATKLYNFLEIGDVVQFPNADGPLMQLGDGYGAWNVPWGQWLTGGLYRTS